MAPTSHVGLGLPCPLVLGIATAPAERIRLFMQTQDEVILNLRKESDLQQRSIIAHAQLPYKDIQDCCQRLVEKEGPKSLWRGYGTEVGRYILQEGIERWMRKSHIFQGLRNMFLFSKEKYGSLPWFIGLSISGTISHSVATIVLYPLALLHTRLATDVVRKSRKPVSKPKTTVSNDVAIKESSDNEGYNVSSNASSIEFVHFEEPGSTLPSDCAPDDDNEASATAQMPHVNIENDSDDEDDDMEAVYEFDYKYHGIKDVYKQTIKNEGYRGLYRGLSCVIAGTFVSRIGYLTIFNLFTPLLTQTGSTGWAGFGSFLLLFGCTSLVSLAVYPFSTIAHRRMVSGDRYKSSCDAAQQIVKKQGVQALFQGAEAALARSAILSIFARLSL
ncbi:hypothetical protein BG004_003899 [Podila humilis]|nr:hypothetical protein BG004_003899 [Podila humilis]